MTWFLKLLALCAILPLVTPNCSIRSAQNHFKRSVYEFSADLLRRIAEDTDGHFVSSTLSPYTLLSAVALGATDETLAEIKNVLHYPKHPCFNSKYLAAAKQALEASDDGVTLERSGVLFIDDAAGLKDAFRKRLTATGVCEVTPLSFEDFSTAALQINDFVRSATHGIIEEIVNAADLEGVYLMMVDALYFKGTWRTSFSLENTEPGTFYDTDGNPIGDVNMMFMTDEFNVTNLAPIQASVLELPYGQSGRFSMLIFLPDEEVSLLNMVDNLKKISLTSIFSQFKRQGPQTVSVQIPRFKITTDLSNLKELLIDMRLKEMFDPNLAKFPLLSDFQLYVSSFVQKADIEVTEEGTVAAAVTDLSFSFRSAVTNLEFSANKPFLFMVVDRSSGVPIFSGAYSKPSMF